jgi:hypothetical protein
VAHLCVRELRKEIRGQQQILKDVEIRGFDSSKIDHNGLRSNFQVIDIE